MRGPTTVKITRKHAEQADWETKQKGLRIRSNISPKYTMKTLLYDLVSYSAGRVNIKYLHDAGTPHQTSQTLNPRWRRCHAFSFSFQFTKTNHYEKT